LSFSPIASPQVNGVININKRRPEGGLGWENIGLGYYAGVQGGWEIKGGGG